MSNVRSLGNKIVNLHYFLDTTSPDVLILTETWLDCSIPDSLLVSHHGYHIFRKDRSSRGGGVIVLVKKLPNVSVCSVAIPSAYHDTEILAIDLCDDSGVIPFRLIAAYRPPSYSSSDNAKFFSALNELADGSPRLCVFGDFNLPLFNWDMFVYPDNYLYRNAAEFVCNHGLTQLVDLPTRGNNILDLVLCSDVLSCDSVCMLPPMGTSDHAVISFNLYVSLLQETTSTTTSNLTRPNYSKADWSSICCHLSTVNWSNVFYSCTSVEQYWDAFVSIFDECVNYFVPCYKPTVHTANVKHYPNHVRKLMNKKYSCWKLFRRFRSKELLAKYKLASQACSDSIKDYVTQYENNLISDGKLGNFYKYINHKFNGSTGIGSLLNSSGEIVHSSDAKANLLNDYFSSVFTVDNGIIDAGRLPSKTNSIMPPVFFTPAIVMKHIKHLRPNASPGPDGIPAEFFKATASFVSLPLSVIFNISLQTGELPSIWKHACITPVFKKGSSSNPSNYRPISLTCIACKLIEMGIKETLMNHLLQHKLISHHQHGFLCRKSTSTQLLECCEDWNVAMNTHSSVDVVYLDFAKAFDSVVHSKLLAKLACYGIGQILLSWIRSFLSNRYQYVKVDKSYSSILPVMSGVPQGSVLGPVLFILYVNDINVLAPVGVTIKLFADDTKLYTTLSDRIPATHLQSCLSAIFEWSEHWQLKLSPSKCSVMRITSAALRPIHNIIEYFIGHVKLPVVDHITDLGITYNNKFKFSPHVDNIVAKASLRAKLILRCFQSRDPVLLTKAFCVFVRPLLEFGSAVWNPVLMQDICKVESVQRRFTKRLKGIRNLPYTSRLTNLGLDSLHCRRTKADLCMCYKIINNYTCTQVASALTFSSTKQTRGNSRKLDKSHISSVRDGHSFSKRIINAWNSLPDCAVLSRTVKTFKFEISKLHFSDYCVNYI